MNIELSILKSMLKDKCLYNKYYSYIKDIKTEKEINLLFQLIHNYYTQYELHNYISIDELKAYFQLEYSNIKSPELYNIIFDNLKIIETSDSIAKDSIRKYIEKDCINKIVQEALPALSGEQNNAIETIEGLIETYYSVVDIQKVTEQDLRQEVSLDSLIAETSSDGLCWRLNCLNEDLGPLCGGSLGHFMARPDYGKTSFIHSELSNFVKQLKDENACVIWFNNEEDEKKIRLRFYSSVCGLSREDILCNTSHAKQLFTVNNGKKMLLYDQSIISIDNVSKICGIYKPRIVIVDVGDKIVFKNMDKASNGADRLKGIYDSLREIAKKCNKSWKMDIITTGQADAAAERKKWLYQTNLDSGKTGKAGAFDYIIGMGAVDKEDAQRYVYCCKNKNKTQSGKHVVLFDKLRARFRDA